MQTTSVEQLPCKLSAHEKLLKSDQMAAKHGEIAQLEAAKKSATSSFSSSIKQKQTELTQLAEEIRSGEELRPVECVEKPRYADLMVDLVRLDTGVVVTNRPMHPRERQSALELGDAPRKTTPAQPRSKGKTKVTAGWSREIKAPAEGKARAAKSNTSDEASEETH